MFVFLIPQLGRVATCVSLALAATATVVLGVPYSALACGIALVVSVWSVAVYQKVTVSKTVVTLSLTAFHRRISRETIVPITSDVTAVLSVLLRRRGMSRPLRRIAFLVDGKALCWTRALHGQIEQELVLALTDIAGLHVQTVGSGRIFPPLRQ